MITLNVIIIAIYVVPYAHQTWQVQMENFRQEMEEIALENKRLHLQIEMTSLDSNSQKEKPVTQLLVTDCIDINN